MTTTTDLVHRYFLLAADPSRDAYFAQFTTDASVEDEGHLHHGIEEIRSWRTTVPSVRYDVLDVTTDREGTTTARADISGDFPGSPVTLVFRFGFSADQQIRTLTIRT